MDAERHYRAKELLYAVTGLVPAERERYLDEQCGDDDELRREVESLLGHLERSELPDLWAADPDADDEIEVAFENYRILEELGRGGQGVVYLAEDTRLHRRVALKVLTGVAARSRSMRSRLKREAEAASKLDHPGICSVFEVGEEGGVPFIAMRYVEGESLARRIAAREDSRRTDGQTTTTGTTSTGRAAVIEEVLLIEKTALALHAAHEAALVHRDVKPGNVMVTRSGDPVLLDFGLAHDEETDAPALTATGQIMGTPAYMAPEQITGDRTRIDRRTDVYALAVTLYETLTLRRPFEGLTREHLYQQILTSEPADPRRLNSSIPTDLKAVLEVGLDKDPDRRYQTAADLAGDLRRVRESRPIRARPAGALVKVQRWARRRPAAAILLLVLALGTPLLAAMGGYLLASRDVIERGREATRRQDVNALLEQALIQQAVDSDMAAAVRTLEQALEIEPDMPVALVELTTIHLFAVRRPAKALAVLDRHRALETTHPALLRIRAMALRALERDREAEIAEARVGKPVTAFDYYVAGVSERHTRSDRNAVMLARAVNLLTQAVYRSAESRGIYLFLLASSAAIAGDTEVTRRATLAFEPRLAHIGAYLRGLACSQSGDPTHAAVHYEIAVRRRPTFVAALGNLAACRRQQGELDDAMTLVDRVLELDPDRLEAHILRRVILVAQRGRRDAIEHFRARLAPDRPWDHFSLGALLHEDRDVEAAIPHFRVAARLRPNVFDAQVNLGICLAARGKFDEAIPHYRKAVELRWNDAMAHAGLGRALERTGDFDGALREYRYAIRIDPRSASAHTQIRRALVERLGPAKAIGALEEVLHSHPSCAWIHINLGSVHESLRHRETALDHYREAVRLDPTLHASQTCLGGALLRTEDFEGAIVAFREAVRIDPSHPTPYQGLRIAYLQSVGLRGAAGAFREFVRNHPENARAYYHLGAILFLLGDAVGAERRFQGAVRLQPRLVEAHLGAGRARLCLGRLEAAVEALERARRLGPGHREVRGLLESLQALQGHERALGAVAAGAEAPDDPRERLRLAELAALTQRFELAARLFEAALAASPALASSASPFRLQSYRWCAAAAAVRAAAAEPDRADRRRAQAVTWLREDLAALLRRRAARKVTTEELLRGLGFWRQCPDLADVRDPGRLLRLPPPEQRACAALWADVDRSISACDPAAAK